MWPSPVVPSGSTLTGRDRWCREVNHRPKPLVIQLLNRQNGIVGSGDGLDDRQTEPVPVATFCVTTAAVRVGESREIVIEPIGFVADGQGHGAIGFRHHGHFDGCVWPGVVERVVDQIEGP